VATGIGYFNDIETTRERSKFCRYGFPSATAHDNRIPFGGVCSGAGKLLEVLEVARDAPRKRSTCVHQMCEVITVNN